VSGPGAPVRRRSDGEETRRRVLDAVVETIIEVGYYKASSNEIARRAGVTWGAIHHLFGSREQLMLEVFHDLGAQFQERFADARVEGDTLEERLHSVLELMAARSEHPRFLVEVQILMDLSSNPRVPEEARRVMRRRNGEKLAEIVRPLFAQAMGEGVPDDLVLYAFTVVNGYLTSRVLLGFTAELPSDDEMRRHLVHGLAASIGDPAATRARRPLDGGSGSVLP
jgi:AcrR family transcriptional regulator